MIHTHTLGSAWVQSFGHHAYINNCVRDIPNMTVCLNESRSKRSRALRLPGDHVNTCSSFTGSSSSNSLSSFFLDSLSAPIHPAVAHQAEATAEAAAQALHAYITARDGRAMLAAQIVHFLEDNPEHAAIFPPRKSGLVSKFALSWPQYFTLEQTTSNTSVKIRAKDLPPVEPAVSAAKATTEATAQALHAFVSTFPNGSMWASAISQFYADTQLHAQYAHVLTGKKGVLKKFVLSWPQYFKLGAFPDKPRTEYIQALDLTPPPHLQAANVIPPEIAVPQQAAASSITSSAAFYNNISTTTSHSLSPVQQSLLSDEEVSVLLGVLHPALRVGLLADVADCRRLRDITLDIDRPIAAYLSQPDQRADLPPVIVTQEYMAYTVNRIGAGAFGADDRAGLSSTLHRVSALRNRQGVIIGLTMRVGRALAGIAGMIQDVVLKTNKSILILGEPGSGKTSLVRDVARLLAETQNVCIIDTSNEIGGEGDVPHRSIGKARRVMIPSLEAQATHMVRCVQNHTPQVMVVDEIGRSAEVAAVSTVKARGVRMVASAHGSFRELYQNAQLKGLLGSFQKEL
eukprot:2256-Heterococcus_DN1.PRE.1